jgi:hypothetical protein
VQHWHQGRLSGLSGWQMSSQFPVYQYLIWLSAEGFLQDFLQQNICNSSIQFIIQQLVGNLSHIAALVNTRVRLGADNTEE